MGAAHHVGGQRFRQTPFAAVAAGAVVMAALAAAMSTIGADLPFPRSLGFVAALTFAVAPLVVRSSRSSWVRAVARVLLALATIVAMFAMAALGKHALLSADVWAECRAPGTVGDGDCGANPALLPLGGLAVLAVGVFATWRLTTGRHHVTAGVQGRGVRRAR